MTKSNAGVCAIKSEFIVQRTVKNDADNNANPDGKRKLDGSSDIVADDNLETKKIKTEENNGKYNASKNKKRGQNKSRPKTYQGDKETKPCPSITNVESAEESKPCQYNNCKFIHDPLDYLKSKPEDLGDACHVFNLRGKCPRGIACRFGSSHITEQGYNVVNREKVELWKEDVKNTLLPSLQTQLQKKKI